jgi:SAM-dependent methyltransferase
VITLATVTYSRVAALAFPFVTVALAVFAFMYFHPPEDDPDAKPHAPRTFAFHTGSSADPTETAFETVYHDSRWGQNVEGVGHSGTGSTMAATLLYRTFLQQFLADNHIHSVVDAGCGDWEFSQAIDWTGIDYQGFDIVGELVDADTKRFGKPNIQFIHANIVDTDLPPADLLIAKHVLQHLPTADIQKFLTQLPKYKHVLFTDGVDPTYLSALNTDIQPGSYRVLDLMRPPFNLTGVKVLTYWDGKDMHQVEHFVPSSD